MKPRRVIVTIEMETSSSIAELKENYRCPSLFDDKIDQVQVNVVRQPEPKRKK